MEPFIALSNMLWVSSSTDRIQLLPQAIISSQPIYDCTTHQVVNSENEIVNTAIC